ncbi:ABC transporter substrate-binding protein [Paenibacillus validus]|uniref:Extracellular solute-binding protein n=1 Tax=Paenibacillus validus TaxID=44253 RepID=A0A7X2Z9F4_9BACL|nr:MULTISPECIES: ABC transporter substrate-binding protein [Paenibacillus]MED4600740.1 ABC transporter substrate-binding protein [Paenibacillus validus]MED4606189.1 ABC transporter substrate-binding protein [Paenibacillus validus]MUG70798.1 extracellular solute-binding protein [Paenibacillus validus]
MNAKKIVSLSLAAIMAMSVAAGCAKKEEAPSTGGTEGNAGAAKNVTLKMFQFKVEIAEPLAKLAAEYEKANPGVKIQIDTVGGGADYGAALMAKFNSGDKPDIFNNGGFSDLDKWIEHLEDLSAEPWVKDLVDVAKEPMTKDGKLYGQPLNLEGYGFLYNKDLFAQAGITETPKTISQLEDAAKKLQAKNITPFVNGYAEWWVLGNHFVNLPFAYQPDPNKFIADLNSGAAKIPGNPVFDQWVKLFDLQLQYGNKNPLQTDYKTQVTEFATGKAAMTQQGNWTQLQLTQTNPNLKVGFLPMPISDDAAANDKLPVGVPNNWVINKNSPNKEEAKKFLNWLVTSDMGKKYIVEEFKFIPAFKSIPADEKILGPLAADIIRYSKDNKTLSWNWFKFPGGEASSKKFAATMQAYVAKQKTKDQMLTEFQQTWDSLKK